MGRSPRTSGSISAIALAGAAWRRFRWARRDEARAALWGGRLGYARQPGFPYRVDAVEPAAVCAPASMPASIRVGVLGGGPVADMLASCARVFGMDVVDPAREPDVPLLLGAADAADPGMVDRCVRGGGVALLLDAGAGDAVDVDGVAFPASGAAVTHAFAGTVARGRLRTRTLPPDPGTHVLAEAPDGGPPLWTERPLGAGRILRSALPLPAPARVADALGTARGLGLLPALMTVRWAAGEAGWHAPFALANVTIDDPALRAGLLGLSYADLVASAREDGMHVTIATIPRELDLAEAPIVELLREGRAVSACYHGWEHDGYEFYLPGGRRMRHGARPLPRQRRALERAVAAGSAFEERHGHALDRVMVFPHGICPAATLSELSRLGFLATSNQGDRYPLDAPVPGDEMLGVRPADTAWSGFPLLWRHELREPRHALDLLFGRPLLAFTHLPELDGGLDPLHRLAADVRRVAGGAVRWSGLEDVARHAYLQRRHPDRGWEALLTGAEACLHNPDDEPRAMRLLRPGLAGVVTVPAGACARVRAGGDVVAEPVSCRLER